MCYQCIYGALVGSLLVVVCWSEFGMSAFKSKWRWRGVSYVMFGLEE